MPHPEPRWSSDRELVTQILGGSREHFELLYASYFPRVYRFALKRLGDPAEAEDVAAGMCDRGKARRRGGCRRTKLGAEFACGTGVGPVHVTGPR